MPGIFGLHGIEKDSAAELAGMANAMRLENSYVEDQQFVAGRFAASRMHLGCVGDPVSPEVHGSGLYAWVEGEAYNLDDQILRASRPRTRGCLAFPPAPLVLNTSCDTTRAAARYVRPESRCRPGRAWRVRCRASGLRAILSETLKNDAARRFCHLSDTLNGQYHRPAPKCSTLEPWGPGTGPPGPSRIRK
jgi:hypothetical protein